MLNSRINKIISSSIGCPYDIDFLSKMMLLGEDKRTTKQRATVKRIVSKYFS